MHRYGLIHLLIFILLDAGIGLSYQVQAADNKHFKSKDIHIRLTPRTPQQMLAFYDARGFKQAMLEKIKQYCFITVFIRNTSHDVIWHDLNSWTFKQAGSELKRLNRHQLNHIWQDMGIPLAHQSTFRWTLLPEQLDFRAQEREGGNIVLPWTEDPMQITAHFATLADKSGRPIIIHFNNIYCRK